MARNPFYPGVGARPPYLAGRETHLRLFERALLDYPEKRTNVRVTGLRGVGKTVLLKEYERIAFDEDWVVIRRELTSRMSDEAAFASSVEEWFSAAVDELTPTRKLKAAARSGLAKLPQVSGEIAGVTVSLSEPGAGTKDRERALENSLREAILEVGGYARGRGVVFLLDEAHSLVDRPSEGMYALGALLGAFVAAQDDDKQPLPVMLVLCGLPSLIANIHNARSNAERLFRAQPVTNLSLEPGEGRPSPAELALTEPVATSGAIRFASETAREIAEEVDGYPYFLQWFGESLWEAADLHRRPEIDTPLFERERPTIRAALDENFFEPRYHDATKADRTTLRVAGSLGDEAFAKSALDGKLPKSANAVAQSLRRLIAANVIYRDDHGSYRYTAPLFGDFLRRRHPAENADLGTHVDGGAV